MLTWNIAEQLVEQLTIQGRLSELARVQEWLNGLADRFGFKDATRFGIELCMEEVLANVILHGYGGDSDRPVTIRFFYPRQECYVFEVEDEAPLFNPLEAAELPPLDPEDQTRIGGQGLRLLRRFASELSYEEGTNGNRLRMVFDAGGRPSTR